MASKSEFKRRAAKTAMVATLVTVGSTYGLMLLQQRSVRDSLNRFWDGARNIASEAWGDRPVSHSEYMRLQRKTDDLSMEVREYRMELARSGHKETARGSEPGAREGRQKAWHLRTGTWYRFDSSGTPVPANNEWPGTPGRRLNQGAKLNWMARH